MRKGSDHFSAAVARAADSALAGRGISAEAALEMAPLRAA